MKHARQYIVEELRKDDELRLIHLNDALTNLFNGDKRTGLLMLRDIVNATCGFPQLAVELNKPDKSVQRMLSGTGNPTAENLIGIIQHVLNQENAKIELKRIKKAA